MAFMELIDLASERLGGTVIYANDEFFAPKENLLKQSAPVFIEGKYTDNGKWMDGWESARRRTPGYDWCVIRLGLAGRVRGVMVDTSHFKGNYPEQCSIDAATVDGQPGLDHLLSDQVEWSEVLPVSQLKGDSQNLFPVGTEERFTHLKFKIYPDGGVARLRVYGEVVPDWGRIIRRGGEIDLAAVEHGGLVLSCSDMFFGHRHNMIMPGRAMNMSDGWETKRRRGPGHDWSVIKLGRPGIISRVEVDTSWFKGNYPESCSMEAVQPEGAELTEGELSGLSWQEILPRVRLQAHTRHLFEDEIREAGAATLVRFNIYPDGGVSRLRIMGKVQGD
jgi:allantoicase